MKEQIKQHKPTKEELQTFGKEIFAVLSAYTNNYNNDLLLVYLWNKLYTDYIGTEENPIGFAWEVTREKIEEIRTNFISAGPLNAIYAIAKYPTYIYMSNIPDVCRNLLKKLEEKYPEFIGPIRKYGKHDFDKYKIIYISVPENIETISPADVVIAEATSYLVIKFFETVLPALYEIFKIPGNFEKYTDELCEQYRKDNDNGN